MQLPTLFGVRGSIATQTMSNLTEEQVKEVDRIVREIKEDPTLAPNKYEFIKQLGKTIGGDYRSDRSIAEHEFAVAVWRATIYLLHHRSYSYSCTLCGATEYETSTGKRKAFDRQYAICPHCSNTILDGQIVHLKRLTKGYSLIDEDGSPVSEKFRRRVEIDKIVDSPIKTILGDRKVEDPEKILADPEQRCKWYTVWVWNYFRQILNENTIRHHNKQEVEVFGPAHIVAAQIIVNELRRIKHKYYLDESNLDQNREIEILTSVWTMPASNVGFLQPIREIYRNYGVEIDASSQFAIKIRITSDEIQDTQATISTEDPVIMLSLDTPKSNTNNNSTRNWSDILESNSIDSGRNERHSISEIVDEDWMIAVRRNLPDDICRRIFDIYTQNGESWSEFSDIYGHKEAAKSHLSKYFGISTRKVEEYRQNIAKMCREHGIGSNEPEPEYGIGYGDSILVIEEDEGPIVHFDFDCPTLPEELNSEFCDKFKVGMILGTRREFARIEGYDRLIKICPTCCGVLCG